MSFKALWGVSKKTSDLGYCWQPSQTQTLYDDDHAESSQKKTPNRRLNKCVGDRGPRLNRTCKSPVCVRK